MFDFFLPASKVQKDRKIIKETDRRMAKYSLRGIVFNFLIFLICIVGGRFISEFPVLAYTLTGGLLLISLARGYILLRFDNLYPRAPRKWRNTYFVVTLIGALWWGVITSSITIKLELENEANLIWLYTVVFFSTTANAFAPYHRFLSYYQFFGIVPAAASAVFLGTVEGYLYGLLMLVFYLMLSHQCRIMSQNYWERREAAYALARQTHYMEEEKRDTKSSVVLHKEFLHNLNHDLLGLSESIVRATRALPISDTKFRIENLSKEIKLVHQRVKEFDGVVSKKLELANKIFNIRHEIQHIVSDFIDDAEINNVQIETALSPSLPMRLRGDPVRFAQVIKTLLRNILRNGSASIVLIEVEFIREYENAGELYVSFSRSYGDDDSKQDDQSIRKKIESTDFVVAKGLAELMKGSVELVATENTEDKIRFNAKMEVANREGQLDFHRNFFKGKSVLLVHSKPKIVDIKRQELDALGFNVFTETQYARAENTLLNSYKFHAPIESILCYVEPQEEEVQTFFKLLKENEQLRPTKKLVAATRKQEQAYRALGYDESCGFIYVDKPTGLFELENAFVEIYKDDDSETVKKSFAKLNLTVCSDMAKIREGLLADVEALSCSHVTVGPDNILDYLSFNGQEIVLLDYDTLQDVSSVVETIRLEEAKNGKEFNVPIIGISAVKSEMDEKIYILGLDDFVDLAHNSKKTLRGTLTYWHSLI